MLKVRLLGAFEISSDGGPVVISSRPAQSLFAYLILNSGTSHRREKLAGMLWPDSLEETARDNLRHALWRMRKALLGDGTEGYLIADDLTIGFKEESDYWLDARDMEKAGEDAPTDEFARALSAYQGELLPGFYDEWVVLEREHLQSMFEHKMARLMARLQDEDRWLEILDWGERWIKFGQQPEPAYRALMMAHAVKGEMSKVAATYERCLRSFAELGIEPSQQTQQLYENLKAGRAAPAAGPLAVGPAYKSPGATIPIPLTSFVGRERELVEIPKLLSASRLLTLTGPGGVGKTRLAIEVARESAQHFKDGVYWVELSNLSDDNLIPQAVAQSLEVREIPGEPLMDTVQARLRSKDLLMVLDNCEHLIRACAQFADRLLAACPRLRILATSIEALGLYNETICLVPSLPLPEAERSLSLSELLNFASIELFEERSRNAKPGFALNVHNVSSVTQICRRLDGIPLAIELAAARIRVLSVDEIAARLNDRFSLLTAGSRTAIPRHQTLRATIDWSYELLRDQERILFRRLSVFSGGFTLQAAEEVCGQGNLEQAEILDLLARLVDKSLADAEIGAATDESRYRLLETIRQYALEKLGQAGEAHTIRDRHLLFFLRFAERVGPKVFGSDAGIWFRRVDKEIGNLRAAMEWAMYSGNATAAMQMAGSLVDFMFVHGALLAEWYDRNQQALSQPEGKERTLARATALLGIGFMSWAEVYPTDRRPELEEALSIGRELGDRKTVATALRTLGLLASLRGDYDEARSLLGQSLEVWEAMGIEGRSGKSWTLMFLGDAAYAQGDIELAGSLYAEARTNLAEIGDINFLGYSVRRLALLAWGQGDAATAIPLCRDSLLLNQDSGDPRGIIACLAGFAAIALVQARLERAAVLLAAVETHLASIHIRLLPVDRAEYEHSLTLLRSKLDGQSLAVAWERGREMSLDEAARFALDGAEHG